jgi:hypothetical protein
MAGEFRRIHKAVDPFLKDLGVELGLFLIGPLRLVGKFGRMPLRIGAGDVGFRLLPCQLRDKMVLQQFVLRPKDDDQLIKECNLGIDQLLGSLRLLVSDVDLGAGLRQLELELLQLLAGSLDCRLVIELGETLAAHHVVETLNEKVLQARLDNWGNRSEFAGDDTAASERCSVGRESCNDCRPNGKQRCARSRNPPQSSTRRVGAYREHATTIGSIS